MLPSNPVPNVHEAAADATSTGGPLVSGLRPTARYLTVPLDTVSRDRSARWLPVYLAPMIISFSPYR